MLGLLSVLWLAVAGPLGPDLPPLELRYLGPSTLTWPARPDTIAGLDPSSPNAAVAILFKGAFDFGGTDALTAALDAAPHVRLIAFDSPGGRPLVADGVAQVIRSRHLDTTVEEFCASACTIAYVAGTVRTAGRHARFGFHLGTGPVLANMAATVALQIERKWFVRGGASLSFAERALHAPNPDPYFAPLLELLAAGYIHRVVSTMQGTTQAGGNTALPEEPGGTVSAMAALEAVTAEALALGQAARTRHGHMTQERSAAMSEQMAALVVGRWFSRSSDTADLALVDAQLAALDWLAGHDAAGCMRWLIGQNEQDLSLAMLPAGIQAALQSAQADVLRDANAFPVPLPAESGALATADAAVRRAVAAAFGPRALGNAASREHGFDDPALSCGASAAYLRGLRERPEGAGLLRWALAAG